MLDLIGIVIVLVFFASCYALLVGLDKLMEK